MPIFRVRLFLAILGFAVFTLLFVSVGIRWHTYRARAAYYARQEVDHTFKAADSARAALGSSSSEEDQELAASHRTRAAMHARAARECSVLRELYETCW